MYHSMPRRLLLSSARPCRFIARRRYPPAAVGFSRQFHISRTWLSSVPPDPHGTADSPSGTFTNDASPFNAEEHLPEHVSPNRTPTAEGEAKKEHGPYGSGVRRAMRNKRPSRNWTPPTATIPDWFHERNTIVNSDGQRIVPLQQVRIDDSQTGPDQAAEEGLAYGAGSDGGEQPGSGEQPESEHRYALTEAVWEELRASVKAGLRLPPSKYANEPSALKSHLVLHYPGNDGILFLDAVVKRLANEIGLDIVTLNAQDITQLCSEQDLADNGMSSSIRSLSYEVYRPSLPATLQEFDDSIGEGEDDADVIDTRNVRSEVSTPKFITIESSRDLGEVPLPTWLGLRSLVSSVGTNGSAGRGTSNRIEHSWLRLINELISSSGKGSKLPSRREESSAEAQLTGTRKTGQARDLIIQVQDCRDIQATREGSKFISLLQQAIQSRRQEGSRVLLIGTVAKEINNLTSQDASLDDDFSKTLIITPAAGLHVAGAFVEDRKRRTMDINIRHLQNMLRTRLSEQSSAIDENILTSRDWPLSTSIVKESGLDERYWSYNQIHWVATLALGCAEPEERLGFAHIQRGIEVMQRADSIKNSWLQETSPKAQASEMGNDRERLLKSLRKTCNTHEKKLLNGVVDAKSIHTTFADVHVAPETIETLKTLTTLSLIRPEAFTYGVLARDKIPGLLLYGPPGTGKTLLAKAVAHESGATVLEVSGSEVYDMYVGEGEKNVKAIFTLAKKLSPCVVFIDEADAIFCSRTGASNRTSHRELINQFLREWDGMNNLSAFIMVATNRPFDLDDAVLRRLPRRLLVDLPTEQDRLAILKIHLKDEDLDASVDLPELSRRTPFYSGSDLKNLCVAAALACVRQENNLAAQHQGEEPYQYPSKRTLTWEHFERGMEEISASISEDMASLSAIRKFDEQYGDRKGRRKRGPGWGFVPSNAVSPSADTVRVRT
ncbi:hypothetical protein MAP00_005904 [Monascus purpureus]|nr:hypothetical protein MAP00_005904 [Monascus purpureus]